MGHIAWNKGKIGYTNGGSFKKGHIPWSMGIKRPEMSQRLKGNTYLVGKYREESNHWKGGFTKDSKGYMFFRVPKGCRFACMADKKGYVLVHRLMMAEFLQRPLTSEESVHHKNGKKEDNRVENLMYFENEGKHQVYHNKFKKEMILV